MNHLPSYESQYGFVQRASPVGDLRCPNALAKRSIALRGVDSRDHNYVIVELRGRLGNQLFQFASGYALARRRDARLLFIPYRVPSDDLLLPQLIGARYREPTDVELLRVGAWNYDVPGKRRPAGSERCAPR